MAFKIRSKLIIAIVIIGALAGLFYYCFAMPTLQLHNGDGTFANISWRFPWRTFGFPVPGYRITFPEFELADDFTAVYHIQELPMIKGQEAICYLTVEDPNGQWNDKRISELSARFELDVADENGKTICHVARPLRELIWSSGAMNGKIGHGLYSLDESRFVPNSKSQYTLKVQYIGDPQFKSAKGCITIECGGYI